MPPYLRAPTTAAWSCLGNASNAEVEKVARQRPYDERSVLAYGIAHSPGVRSLEVPMRTMTGLALSIAVLFVLAACGQPSGGPPGGQPPDDDEVLIPDTTKVLDASARTALVDVAEDGTLRFASTGGVVADLEPDDVIASEPAGAAPNGLLRKVVSVRVEGGETIVETTGAEIREAIHQGSLSARIDLDEADLEQSLSLQSGVRVQAFTHDLDTDFGTDGRVQATGTVEIDPILDFDMGISCDDKILGVCAEIPDLDVLVRMGIEESSDIEFEAQEEADYDEEFLIALHQFSPITFSIGPVPVVLTPQLEIYLGAEGEVSASLSFRTSQELTMAGGFEFNSDAGFRNLSERSEDFEVGTIDFEARAEARAFVGARYQVLLYGVIGPFGALEAGPSLEADLQGLPGSGDLIYAFEGCLTGTVGINSVDVLDLNYDAELFDLCATFAEEANTEPGVNVRLPQEDSEIFEGEEVVLRANTFDTDGHDVDCEWSSSRGEDPLAGVGCEGTTTFSSLGERTLTVTATDPFGATDTDSVTVNVEAAPTILVQIHEPTGDQNFRPDESITLEGSAQGGAEPHTLEWSGEIEMSDVQQVDIGTGSSLTWTPEDDLEFDDCFQGDDGGVFELTLTATDAEGRTESRSIDFFISHICIE